MRCGGGVGGEPSAPISTPLAVGEARAGGALAGVSDFTRELNHALESRSLSSTMFYES